MCQFENGFILGILFMDNGKIVVLVFRMAQSDFLFRLPMPNK